MNGLNGNEAAQPRVFAHDAVPLNMSVSTGATFGFAKRLEIGNDSATGYTLNEVVQDSSLKVKIQIISLKPSGKIGAIRIVNPGTGCQVGSVISFTPSSGTGTTSIIVRELGLPGTDQRGACLFVGGAGTTGTICVKMESGDVVTFKGVTAGSFLPILAIDVLRTATDANGTATLTDVTDVIALY
jgi:hypothetical protein|tara:strand:- start:977 stop:1531 length:555 start_codon:yes stop_codon:yes gene_type:complete